MHLDRDRRPTNGTTLKAIKDQLLDVEIYGQFPCGGHLQALRVVVVLRLASGASHARRRACETLSAALVVPLSDGSRSTAAGDWGLNRGNEG
jgi:hypothetical protein